MKNKIEELIKNTIMELRSERKINSFCLEQATQNLIEQSDGNNELTGYKIASMFLDLEKEQIIKKSLLETVANYHFDNPEKDAAFEVRAAELFLDDETYFVFSKICWKIASLIDPGNARNTHLLGRTKVREAGKAASEERRNDLLEEAKTYFRKASKDDEKFVEPHINMGDLYLEDHQFKEALGHYQHAYELQNRSEKLLNNLALCYKATGNTAMFESILFESLALFPHGNAPYFLEQNAKTDLEKYQLRKMLKHEENMDQEILEEVNWPKTKN